MIAEHGTRRRGRPSRRRRFTERLPSVLISPEDLDKLNRILEARDISVSELMRDLISREHSRVARTAK